MIGLIRNNKEICDEETGEEYEQVFFSRLFLVGYLPLIAAFLPTSSINSAFLRFF